jgi:hypothetical protein
MSAGVMFLDKVPVSQACGCFNGIGLRVRFMAVLDYVSKIMCVFLIGHFLFFI